MSMPATPVTDLGARRKPRPSALDRLTLLAREELAQRQIGPGDGDAVMGVVVGVVDGFQRLAALGQETPLADAAGTVAKIIARISGLGPFEPLLAPNGGIEDIFVAGPKVRYFVDGRVRFLTEPISEAAIRRIVEQLLAPTDVSLDRTHPVVDGVQVLDGRARLSAAIPPVSPYLIAAIRLYTNRFATIESLEASGSISSAAAALLTLDVRSKGSILIGGETGSGKSTLLASLLAAVRPSHNVLLIEEFMELQFRPEFGARVQSVPGGKDTPSGADNLKELIKFALRMKPDVLAVGEVRGEESWDLARASRVGAGFLATIHAPSAEEALEALVLTALDSGENRSESLIRQIFSRALDFVVFCERDDPYLLEEGEAYRHQVTEIRALAPILKGDEGFSSEPIFHRPGGIGTPMEWTAKLPPTPLARRLERQLPRGVQLVDVLKGRVDPR